MLRVLFIIVLEIKVGPVDGPWASLSTSPTQQTKRTECCVLGTPTTPEPRYLILSTSLVLTTGDTSSTTTSGLILRILWGILVTLGLEFVKLKCTVRILQGFTLGNETHVFQCKNKKIKKKDGNTNTRTLATFVNICIINESGISHNSKLRIGNLNFSKLIHLFHITFQIKCEICTYNNMVMCF